jgi:thioredoxin 1
MVKQINKSNFKTTIRKNDVVLVDFYADWCGPCKSLAPVLESVADDFKGEAVVSKVNIDKNQPLAVKYNIRSIPALLYFQNGKLIGQTAGLVSKREISKNLKRMLAS